MANILDMKFAFALSVLLFSSLAPISQAAETVYDEKADAKADVQKALAKADGEHRSVLVVFGANWCPDCRVLDATFKQSGPTADLIKKDYEVVKVDLGKYDHNVDLATSYGLDVKKGIPTLALLSSKGEVLFVTKKGELADARHMGDDGIHQFLQKLAIEYPTKS